MFQNVYETMSFIVDKVHTLEPRCDRRKQTVRKKTEAGREKIFLQSGMNLALIGSQVWTTEISISCQCIS